MRFLRRGQTTRPPQPALAEAVVDAWASLCPAFLEAGDADAFIGSAWVTLLPITLKEPEPPNRSEIYAKADPGHGLARVSAIPEAVPAGSSLRLVEVAWYDHIGTAGTVFIFEATDGPMAGTRFNIWDLERDVAWRQGFATISRTISMIVPADAPEVADRELAQIRLRAIEDALESQRLFIIEQWDHIDRRFMGSSFPGPLEPAELPVVGES